MVLDPTASASSSHTCRAIARRVTTDGERRRRTSSRPISVAVRETGLPTDRDLARRRIEDQVAALEPGSDADGWPPLQGPQPGQQFPEVERLDQVVVRPAVEPGDAVRGGVPSREHEDRNVEAPPPRLGDHLDAGDPGHPPVDHGHVVVVAAQVEPGGLPVDHGVHDIAVLTEAPFEDGAEAGIVLGDEDPHVRPDRALAVSDTVPTVPTQADSSMTGPCGRPDPLVGRNFTVSLALPLRRQSVTIPSGCDESKASALVGITSMPADRRMTPATSPPTTPLGPSRRPNCGWPTLSSSTCWPT